MKAFEPGDLPRQQQDFLAGTVPAARAGVAMPEPGPQPGPGPHLGPLFTVFVHEHQRTFGPAPALRDIFELLDQDGGLQLARHLEAGAAWAGLGGPGPLVKLTMTFAAPVRGSAAVVLDGGRHARLWQHIAGGGFIGLTSQERLTRATAGPWLPSPPSWRPRWC